MGNDTTDKTMSDKELNDYTFLQYASPVSWRFKAKGLRHAADRLYSLYHEGFTRDHNNFLINGPKEGELSDEDKTNLWDSMMISEVFLLISYAIENLLKGLLIAKFPEKITLTSKINLGNHDLDSIAKRCNLNLSLRQIDVLQSLELTIKWAGKYPIPLDANDIRYGASRGFTFEELEEENRSKYQEMVDLYTLILTELQSIPEAMTLHSLYTKPRRP